MQCNMHKQTNKKPEKKKSNIIFRIIFSVVEHTVTYEKRKKQETAENENLRNIKLN